jgi:hypothetical protein
VNSLIHTAELGAGIHALWVAAPAMGASNPSSAEIVNMRVAIDRFMNSS